MLKYVSKFVLEIFPSVVATIVGAYIVNHYIVAKPADAPVAAAVSTAQPAADAKAATAKPETKPSDVANLPEPAVAKAKAGSEKGVTEKVADKPVDSASTPAETRRHQPVTREKAVAKVSLPSVPAVATASVAPATETAPAAEERRDANDLARAAIERLRNSGEAARVPEPVRAQEAARLPEAPRIQDAPRAVSAPLLQPLPPAIMVSTPSSETFNPPAARAPEQRIDDPRRPRPPADIPVESRPLDLRAEATGSTRSERPSVADDMLSAAKSVFHAVLPK